MTVSLFKMEARMAAFLAILCLHMAASYQIEPEIIGVVIDNPEEAGLDGNKTTEESDWSRVVNDLAIALERVDKEKSIGKSERGGGREEEEAEKSSGKSRIIKRQIIKIPSSVTKVKVIAPNPMPQTRPKAMASMMPRIPPYSHHQRRRPTRRPQTHSRPAKEIEEDYEEPKHHRIRETDHHREKHSKKHKAVVKEVTPEEFYDEDGHQYISSSQVDTYQKQTKKNHSKKTQRPSHDSGHSYYENFEESAEEVHQRRPRRPPYEEYSYETSSRDRKPDSEYSRPVRTYAERRPSYSNSEYAHDRERRPVSSYSSSEYAHDREYDREDYAASNLHMKQVPAPNLTGLNLIDPPNLMKEEKISATRTAKESSVADFITKAAPMPKDIASSFPPQYTSHNPQVVTNFGLDDGQAKAKTFPATKVGYSKPEEKSVAGLASTRLLTAATEHRSKAIQAGGNGLKVVQPPQLGSGSVSLHGMGQELAETERGNQRATIRDILHQDCPDHEMLGYCSSPPRYPTIQIADMASKCSELSDIMTSPVPPEPEDDLASFTRRSDDPDILFESDGNDTRTVGNFPESWPSWSRSGSESETACSSVYTIIEPGYAREVSSGRWFVIVQNSDSSLQKVTTDTCLNPGKPCGGLAGMKCSRNRGFHSGIKSTRCIQRYTHQRLISWDPESPTKCPTIRIFRFPTACICHLRHM